MFQSRLEALNRSLDECVVTDASGALTLDQGLSRTAKLIHTSSGIVYVIGNGGSAGIASHFSNDLMKALHVPSQTLYDSNLMTCLSNDIGYEHIFRYPLSKLLKPNDLLVAISSSGKSANILNATHIAAERNVPVITLSGFLPDNPLRTSGALNFWVGKSDYGLVESAHFFLLHTLVDLWKQYLGTLDAQNDRAFAAH